MITLVSASYGVTLAHFHINSDYAMAHYEEVAVRGYEEFSQAVSERKGKDIFTYFSGNKDAQGKSWCPDCVKGNVTYCLLGMNLYNITLVGFILNRLD